MQILNSKLNPTARPRRGSLMVEMVVCTILLSLVATMLVPAVYAVQQQRKATRFETLVLIELNNLAVQVQQKETCDAKQIQLSTWFTARYSDAKLILDSIKEDSSPQGVRSVRITISRPDYGGDVEIRRSLTTWYVTKEVPK